jgi:ABC-type Mn2+/Zn2+ transport system ATPase subunit
VSTLHSTNMGCDNDPLHLIMNCVRVGLSDGWGGSMYATDLSDVLFGEPMPIRSRVNLGVLDREKVNVVVHGHEPTLSEAIVAASSDPEILAAAKKVGAYSKGMRQRLGIAEVLVKEPKLVFLDEPTIGLDPDGTNRMLDLIRSLSKEKNITVFFSSHLLEQVQRICDRVGIMIKGNLVAVGPSQELAKNKLGVDR